MRVIGFEMMINHGHMKEPLNHLDIFLGYIV